ncbi:MAG: Rieske (2Fe-2S) protein [Pseudonocardia sp.]|nr:Rieske (2Fe-2S) protein [Pseudonocardia sp.]
MSAPAPTFAVRRYVGPKVSDVPEGGRYIGEFGGRSIGILNVEGRFHAFLNRCPHLSGPLCEGEVLGLVYADGPGNLKFAPERKMLTCPWHGWEFDLETGRSYVNPSRLRARRIPVEVENGKRVVEQLADGSVVQLVRGPYTAEVFEVSVEDEYLVIAVREQVREATP